MTGDNGSEKTDAHLRDARLGRALEHAPDVQEDIRPEAPRRAAILRAARDAVAQAPAMPPSPWWSRWTGWLRGVRGPKRMPWNAALATVLLAGFVTLLWREEPIPSAQTDSPAPAARQEATGAPPAAPAPQVSAELPVPSPDTQAKKATQYPAIRPPSATEVPAPQKAQPPVVVQQEPIPRSVPPVANESKASDAPVSPMPPPAGAAADSAAPAAVAKQQERARAAAPMAMRAPAVVPALPMDWTHVRRAEATAAQTGVPRAAAGDLPGLLDALKTSGESERAPAQQAGDGLSAASTARVVLLRESSVLGVLELSGQRWRFMPETGSGLLARQGTLTEAEAQTLLAALQRVTP